ncbi:hypothetical protein ABH897_002944 [Paenibacillus sp. RC73]
MKNALASTSCVSNLKKEMILMNVTVDSANLAVE